MQIGKYLIEKLIRGGVKHVFGVPGDFVLGFYDLLQKSPIKIINTCDEQGAGFAADAYARLNGLGCVCVTYGVGGLKIVNTTAEAYAEKSPVIVISGAPGVEEIKGDPLLHHRTAHFDDQRRIFERITVASVYLGDPNTACADIDHAFETATRLKRPVYIELPRDRVNSLVKSKSKTPKFPTQSDPQALHEALEEAVDMINGARKPVILAGVEMHRFGLQKQLIELVEKTNIPVAATILGKSVVSESMPRYLGVYEGGMGHDDVRKYVESSDCLILLGAMLTDINLGIYTAHLNYTKMISATTERLTVHHHHYDQVQLKDFVNGLLQAKLKKRPMKNIPHPLPPKAFFAANRKITTNRVFECLNSFIEDDTMVVADVGDALFGAIDLYIATKTEFISPAYYASLGFGVPGALGAYLAKPKLRPLVIVGDGAFQMTGMELSTIARFGLNPIVVVINNKGYGTERPMMDGAFNDILNWEYSKLPALLGTGKGYKVTTEKGLVSALQSAKNNKSTFSILDVVLEKHDYTKVLRQLTKGISKKIKK